MKAPEEMHVQRRYIVMKLYRRIILFVAIATLLGSWGAELGAQAKPTGELN